MLFSLLFFFSSRRRHTRFDCDWSSDVCSSDLRSPIERRKTYELVAERLTEEISSRALSPGDLLPPERELVASFGVGRSSVREALRMLESRGLIASRGNGAFAVASLRNPLDHSLN